MISLFTGAGGLDWGFHKNKNYDLIISNEILKPHLKTYTDNHNLKMLKIDDYDDFQKNIGVWGDIHELTVKQKADIVIGGPPCQDFSVLRGSENREGFTVKRGKLYQQFLRIIKSTNPNMFVFENVVGMVSANKGAAYETIQNDFIESGYDLIFNEIINFADIGVPQARKRLIIIGIQKELNYNKKNVEITINKYLKNSILKKYPLVPIEIFEGLPLNQLGNRYEQIMKQYSNCMDGIDNDESKKWKEEYSNLTFNIIEDYVELNNIINFNKEEFEDALNHHMDILKLLGYYKNRIDEGIYLDGSNNLGRKNKNVTERMHHIPPSYNFKAVENTKWQVKGLMSNIYRRIHPLKPSPTIIAYGGGGTGGYHYEYNRQGLTNRERARLQTFPDNYLFNGKTTEIRAQIGEAVPPLASYFIEKTVSEIFKQLNFF